jgi:hypothetical protein
MTGIGLHGLQSRVGWEKNEKNNDNGWAARGRRDESDLGCMRK